jgi:hypothetical protein
MTKVLIVLGILLVVAGGSLTALSDDGSDDAGAGAGTSRQLQDTPPVAETPPTPAPPPTEAPVTNRQDCSAIRGQQYLSDEERTWFLANCLSR